MEVRARFALIGLFALAVIGAGFGFVYWLETVGGLEARTTYKVRFEGGVAGLLRGSAVLFNGVRVGEVARLTLDAARPEDVVVELSVDRSAPVRADTQVGIDFQGLAGAPAVTLSGGSPDKPALAALPGARPELMAEKNAGQSVSQAARDALRRFDTLINDNAKVFHSTMANIDKFSGALARNSEKVDGIVAGLERLTGAAKKPATRVFDLPAPTKFPGLAQCPQWQLSIPEVTTLAAFDTDRILTRRADGEQEAFDNAQWPDMLPRVVQMRLQQSFENAGLKTVMGRAPEGTRADVTLMPDVRAFFMVAEPAAAAQVEISVRMIGSDGKVQDTRVFRANVPASALDAASAGKALAEAFRSIAAELVGWTCGKG